SAIDSESQAGYDDFGGIAEEALM
ncbi:MAG: hypothetical protein RLZZ511_4294, partial [Cyanobacteriota bacterium]